MASQDYEILRCDTCYRITERKIDPERPDINKCNITYKCRGSLQLVKKTEKQGTIQTDPIAGLKDWKSRFADDSQSSVTVTESKIDMLCGPSHMAIAVRSSVLNPASFNLIFE